jgi:hypothetical protein
MALPSSAPAIPDTGIVAGSPTGGNFSQGAALPNITTTQTQATAAPTFYTDYLNNLATQGQQAGNNAQYVGAQPLQQKAFGQVEQNVGNYQPALSSAINLASSVGNTSLADAVGNMGEANIRRNLAPNATAGLVGSGQFGSSRGATALGDTIANAELGITEQQARAMQQDNINKINAANTLGNLAGQTQALGLGDVNALSTLGGQQQTIAQNQQLFPLQTLTNQSNLLRGFTMPTSTSSSYTGPIPNAYQASPLATIAGLGTLAAGVSKTPLGDAIGKGLGSLIPGVTGYIGKLFSPSTTTPASGPDTTTGPINPDGSNPIDTTDFVIDADGNLVPGP